MRGASRALRGGNTERLQRLIAAIWLGSGFFSGMAAAAAFGAVTNPTIAADVVGAILTRWHYIALLAPLALFLLELKRLRPYVLTLLFSAIMFAALQGFADLRIRAIRIAVDVPISYLDAADPLRRQFGILHGVSTVLLGLQVLIAVIVLLAKAKERTVVSVSVPDPVDHAYVAPPLVMEEPPEITEEPPERGADKARPPT